MERLARAALELWSRYPRAAYEVLDELARLIVGILLRRRLHQIGRWTLHRAGLGDLLGLQPLAIQHVVEVHVAAEVELVGPVESHAALPEQIGQHAMEDRRAHLALDVVANDRQPAVGEALGPVRLRGHEDRDAVDEP